MNMDKKIPEKELLNFYTTCISLILEYASPVFHNALPKYLEIEKLQRSALTIIYPWWPDSDALKQSGLSRLSERRQHLTSKLFSETTQDPTNSLRSLLLPENNCRYQFRRKRTFIAPRTKPIGIRALLLIVTVNILINSFIVFIHILSHVFFITHCRVLTKFSHYNSCNVLKLNT